MNEFGNDWNSAVQQQQDDEQNAMMDQAFQDQQAAWDDYSGLVGKANQQAAQTQLAMQNDIDCLMSLAAGNGGVVPQVAQERFNRKFGFDASKGMGMFSGKYDDKGNFVVQMGTGQMDAQGRPVLQDHVAGPMDQWIMMNRNKAAFSDDVRNQWRGFLSKTYSDAELDRAAGITRPVGSKTETGGTVVPGSWLTGPQKRRGNISAFSADGKGNFSNTDYNETTGRYERTESGQQEKQLSERERIEMMKEQGRNARAEARNQGRIDIANLQADLKALGYDIDLQKLAERSAHNQATEAQQAANEEGRNARAKEMRDVDWAKHDQAVKKWRDQYEIAMKKAKTDEERAEIDRKYKEGRLEIANGNLDLKWSGLEEQSAHHQATEAQKAQELELKKQRLELDKELGKLKLALKDRAKSTQGRAPIPGLDDAMKKVDLANKLMQNASRDDVKKIRGIISEITNQFNLVMEQEASNGGTGEQSAVSGGGSQSSQAKGASKDGELSGGGLKSLYEEEAKRRGFVKKNGKWIKQQ